MNTVRILIWMLNRLLWINLISAPKTIHAISEEQIRSTLLTQSHNSFVTSTVNSCIDISDSINYIDVFPKGHLTSQSKEVFIILNLNFKRSKVLIYFEDDPVGELASLRSHWFFYTCNFGRNLERHFNIFSLVGVRPFDVKDVNCIITGEILGFEHSHSHD